jgi:SSS family transporter
MYRTVGDGIRLHAAALVLAVAAAVPEWWCIALLGLAMILYTEEGGVTATIWTDTIQMFVYLLGAFVCLFAVVQRLPNGVSGALHAASQVGKLNVLNFSTDPSIAYTFWAGVIGGTFLTLGTHGTDHYLVQRLLVARSQRDASIGLVLSGFLVFAQFVLFLFLGTLFWAFYQGKPFARGDEVLPTFVSTELPGPLTGFILAAIVAAALSPSLNSMASTTVRDFYLPFFKKGASEADQMRIGRLFTVIWGLLQMGVAVAAQNISSALDRGLAALGYASGPTVGAFLLGVLAPSANSFGTMTGMVSGLAVTMALGRPIASLQWPGLAWTWNVAVGATVTVAVALLVSRLKKEEP